MAQASGEENRVLLRGVFLSDRRLCYGATMKIAKDAVVAITYTLRDDDGKVLDSNEGKDPMFYLHGHGNIVAGLEAALLGKGEGETITTVVAAQDGYGDYDENRVFEVPKNELGPNVSPQKGMVLTMRGPNGLAIPVTILKVKLRSVVMDGNHQLAGKNLHFSVQVNQVRKAKKEELAHGHAHGPKGHGHGH
jgi:FKBP-type peptidyl-prolyl cis-trans isomerase SlyD